MLMASNDRQDKDVRRYLEAFSGIPDLTRDLETGPKSQLPPAGYVPRSSEDAVLTSFAQLGCLRLKAQRGLISLIDTNRQYILTEATQTLSLLEDSRHDDGDQLWLGSAIIPRGFGIADQLVQQQWQAMQDPSYHSVELLVIDDLQQDPRFHSHPNVFGAPYNRSFAGVTILSPKGRPIGVYGVYDHKPRNGLTDSERHFLRDMSQTVSTYLSLCRIRKDYERKEQMFRGLGSFVQGMQDLAPYSEGRASGTEQDSITPSKAQDQYRDKFRANESPERRSAGHYHITTGPKSTPKGQMQASTAMTEPTSFPALSTQDANQSQAGPHGGDDTGEQAALHKNAKTSLQPKGAVNLFHRAANIICQSGDLSGVVFFDASLALRSEATASFDGGKMGNRPIPERESLTESLAEGPFASTDSSDDGESKGSGSESGDRSHDAAICTVLGASDSGSDHEIQLTEHDLRFLLSKYPDGQTFSVAADGELHSSDGSGSDGDGAGHYHLASRGKPSTSASTLQVEKNIFLSLFRQATGARSLALVPLWHYEQERWSSLALCWTVNDFRLLTVQDDLLYLHIFGNDISSGLARLQALATEKAKATFISSISHELRSPLHGILGSAEFLVATARDSFQADMISAIQQSGKTLLDVLESVLEFSKINDFSQSKSRSLLSGRKSRRANHTGLRSRHKGTRRLKTAPASADHIDLIRATEEVIEATYAAQSFRIQAPEGTEHTRLLIADDSKSSEHVGSHQGALRKRVQIILDMHSNVSGTVRIVPGTWKRILMNLLGNALKYTDEGSIQVSLNVTEITSDPDLCKVTLNVLDTGRGISKEYLASKLFTPFSQEDSFATGIGLGMSIVRQLVKTVSGDIDVTSEVGKGTHVRVTMTLPKGVVDSQGSSHALAHAFDTSPTVRSIRVCVLDPLLSGQDGLDPKSSERASPRSKSVIDLLKEWLRVEATFATTWVPGSADIVICLEPSFALLAHMQQIDNPDDTPQVVFVCLDAMEAAALRADVRIKNNTKPVEIITQPCGPHKLRRVFDSILERITPLQKNSSSPVSRSDSSPKAQDRTPYMSPQAEFPNSAYSSSTDQGTAHALLDPRSQSLPALEWSSSPRRPTPRQSNSVPNGEQKHSRQHHDGHPSILIVDDNPINLRLLSTFLKRANLRYISATNGREAVDIYKSAPAQSIKYVLTDLSMPVLDGMSATKEIREFEQTQFEAYASAQSRPQEKLGEASWSENPFRTRIIALTGLASGAAQIEARNAGIDQYMMKPIRFDELKQCLHVS